MAWGMSMCQQLASLEKYHWCMIGGEAHHQQSETQDGCVVMMVKLWHWYVPVWQTVWCRIWDQMCMCWHHLLGVVSIISLLELDDIWWYLISSQIVESLVKASMGGNFDSTSLWIIPQDVPCGVWNISFLEFGLSFSCHLPGGQIHTLHPNIWRLVKLSGDSVASCKGERLDDWVKVALSSLREW